jgi:hypothetical protein
VLAVALPLPSAARAGAGAPAAGTPAVDQGAGAAPGAAVRPDLGPDLAKLRAELARLRAHFSRPEPRPIELDLEAAPEREATFQSLALARRADRLAREHCPLSEAGEALQPESALVLDAPALLAAALAQVRATATAVGLTGDAPPVDERVPISREEELCALVELNAELEMLLGTEPEYGEIYFALTRALAYGSTLRARFPGRRIPNVQVTGRAASDADIHAWLSRALDQVEEIAARGGHAPLRCAASPGARLIRRGDLLALAETLEAELAWLHRAHGEADALPPIFHPGSRRIDEVLQRAMILALQLDDVASRLTQGGGWPGEGR